MDRPKNIPQVPGVYIFYNQQNRAIYVGKAKNLKNRISSYFQKPTLLGEKTRKMMDQAQKISWIETETELEALLLEADVIKRLKPHYNLALKDDKQYLYIRIGPLGKGQFPAVSTCRQKKSPKYQYFGPYPNSQQVKKILRTLRKIFKFRDCSQNKFKKYQNLGRGCLYTDLGLCPAPCQGKINSADYLKNHLNPLLLFLKGGKKKIIRKMNREMQRASKQQNFEIATEIRDKLESFQYLLQSFRLPEDFLQNMNLPVDRHFRELREISRILYLPIDFQKPFRLEGYDISNLQGKQATGSMVVLQNGQPQKEHYRRFKIKSWSEPNDVLMLKEILLRRLQWIVSRTSEDISLSQKPHLILIDGGIPQFNATKEILEKINLDIPLISLAKKEEIIYHFRAGEIREIKLSRDNPALQLLQRCRDEAHRFAITYHRHIRRKENLPTQN